MIKITSDSTIDLPQEILERYNISTMPLEVLLGEEVYLDGVTINPKMIYEYAEKTGKLPKTAARNSEIYREFFQGFLNEGYTHVIHYSLSSGISASCQEAKKAAEAFDKNVYVIDTLALSTGTALLAIDGAESAAQGMAASDIYERSVSRVPSIQTSFIIDKLEFLYKGGRCSRLALLGANLLKIKPTIEMHEGKLDVGKKFRGKLEVSVENYVDAILERYPTPDCKRIFITHTEIDPSVVDRVRDRLSKAFPFQEILETTAGATITSHCGRGTLGILYFNDGE